MLTYLHADYLFTGTCIYIPLNNPHW